jgi:hypothetical protein
LNDTFAKIADPQQTLAYSGKKMHRWFLGMGLVGLAAGAILAYLDHVDPGALDRFERVMLVLTFVISAGAALYGLVRLRAPGKPALILSPAGLRQHIEWVKDIDIPWSEVRGVDMIDISGRFRGSTVFFPGVTVVLVSQAFYDRHVYIDSGFLRGPGWHLNYVPKGDMVQVALHHSALSATAAELRTAVETRWRAFGSPMPAPDVKPAEQKPETGSVPRVSQRRP